MPRTSKRRTGSVGGAGRRWVIAGITAFVAADLVLVGWAMNSVSATPSAPEGIASTPVLSPTPTTPSPTPPVAASSSAIPNAIAPTHVLAALDGTVAWRATTGPCPQTSATLQLTTDGGATWKPSDASGPTGASSVLRITVRSTTEADAITLDDTACAPQYIGTYVSGDNWATYPDELAGSWYFDPKAPTVVHAPRGSNVATPCKIVVGLAAKDASNAAVLCSDHTLYRTANAGTTWGKPLAVAGAVALAATADGYAIAATDLASCAGVAVSRVSWASGGAASAACFHAPLLQPGTVAIASGGSTLWLWAGDALARSSDGGSTWH